MSSLIKLISDEFSNSRYQFSILMQIQSKNSLNLNEYIMGWDNDPPIRVHSLVLIAFQIITNFPEIVTILSNKPPLS
jgi:hypothetical protein